MGIADILASAGQIYSGFSEAEAAREKLRRQKIDEELAALKLAGEKRLADYDSRVSAGLKDFLPGGSNAIVARTPGEGAVIPATPVDDEGNAMPQDLGAAKSAPVENRLGALEFMHRAALEAGLPDKADAIQKRVSAFKNEGMLETAQAILSGRTEDEIRDTFNRQGGVKLSRVQRVPGSKSTITGITEDGRPIQFDAENMMRSLLSPKEWAGDEAREERLRSREREVGIKTEAQERIAKERADADKVRADAAKLRAEAYSRRQGAGAGPKPPDPAKQRAERRKFSSEVMRYAKQMATSQDEWGKSKVDTDLANQIAGLSNLLVDENPELVSDPIGAVEAAKDRLAELREKARFKADREWGGMAEGAGSEAESFPGLLDATGVREAKPEYVARRSREIVEALLRGARGEAKAAKPPKDYPDAKQAPDGKWYVKRNGKTYLVTGD